MYTRYPISYLEGFSDIMLSTQTLTPGQRYTFSFQKGGFFTFEFGSDAEILQGLRDRLGNYGEVISVSRPFFSNRWVVTVIPTTPVTVDQWTSAFEIAWQDMGYSNITFWRAESGEVSTAQGGISEVLPSVTGAIGKAVGEAVRPVGESLKPIMPYIVIGAGIFIFFTFGGPLLTTLRKK